MEVLRSQIDASVNFVEQDLVGFIESRYVRRTKDYFIAYLSSQTGCNRGCKFCHLTATRQTQFRNCTIPEFIEQAENVFKEYEKDTSAKFVNYNFMARGEVLANPVVIDDSFRLFSELAHISLEYHRLPPRFNLSTIMPVTLKKSLVEMFPVITPTLYYSLYSMDPAFRKKWMPAAMDPNEALRLLAEYQKVSKKIIKIHGAFIAGENDSLESVKEMMAAVTRKRIRAEFNIVRYNTAGPEYGVEAPEQRLHDIMALIAAYMPVKLITRVGTDVHASCGTFVG